MPRRSPVLVLGICAALLTSAGSAVAAPLHDSRIVGGQEATREYAHQVSLEVAGFGCGGTLVTPTKVVTAAHCVFDANGTPYTADQINMRIGTHDISGDEGDAYTAAAVAAHPDYDPVTVVYDAAVITLPEAATQAPLPLIASGDAAIDAPGVTATVIGWGRTSETGDGSEILREVELPVRTEAECADGVGGYDPTVMICAGVLEGGKDSCQGDSGGPLLLPDGSPDGFVLGGIVSFGNGCARPGQLGAYTRLRQSKVTRWVRDRLGFPTAAARASTTTPRAGDLVTLTSESVHPAGTAGLTVNWDLDSDGDADATGKSVTTRFPTAGRKEITYLVEDAQGDSDVGSLVLTVGAAGGRSDFNGDGFSDLAVGVPGEDGATVDGGAVHIQYGSATGLVTTGAQALTMSSPNVAGTTEGDERFGTAVAAGDLNGDGFDDLAVGAPGDKVGTAAAAGSVVVLYGSRTGLSGTGSRLLTQGATYGDVAEADDGFGSALAITDLGKSVHDDLAIGVPQENGGAGLVHVLSGSATGLSAGRQVWTQTALGANPTEAGDNFGAALAAANFGKSAHGDLAIGVPLENGAVTDHGAVHVVYGTANGLTAADDAVFTQNTASVPGTDQAGDRFGAALAAADLASGAQADLAAGAPGKTVAGLAGAGSVIVLPGSATGLTGTASHERHQDTEGMLDAAEAGDGFGSALAAGDIGGGTKADLAVGAPGESVAGKAGAGQVAVLYGSTSTVLATGNQVFHQDSTGVLDAVEIGDEFGATLAAGNYGKTSKGDLVVGVPSEDIGTGLTDAGAIGILYGGTTGALSSAGNQFLHQDTTNLPDASEVGDGFGKGLG